MQKYQCKVCLNTKNNKSQTVCENMFNSKLEYLYFICGKCNCMQLQEEMKDNSNFYPVNYYSFSKSPGIFDKKLTYLRDRYIYTGKGFIGFLLSILAKAPDIRALASVDKDRNKKILDVGAGGGNFVKRLHNLGIFQALGIDPYIQQDIYDSNRILVRKANIEEIDQKFDIIMFNHSFEHMTNFKKVLLKVKNILEDNGTCIIRVPVYPSYAWYKYKENWVQIDAPRHVNIFSIQAMAELCSQCGFMIKYIYDDSNYFQFTGSEKKITLLDKIFRGKLDRLINPFIYIIENYKAQELNKIGQGDQKCFILSKSMETE
jgi:SAM-dependent methyltransferase